MTNVVARTENARLTTLEGVIERGLATFVEVGQALLEIRESRLYRETHGTFEDYCRERWAMRREQADRLIRAADVASLVNPIGLIPNEAVARELAPLRDSPSLVQQAWQEVTERHGPTPTAAQVREVVATRLDVHNHRAQGTGENEWYTPQKYIDLAREVLGEIDLDPASSTAAQTAVAARAFFSEHDDGLSRPWGGRVWLNPPYSQPHVAKFIRKLVQELVAGHVTHAILLTHNYTDTTWFHDAAAHCAAICFTRGRVRFVSPDGEEASPTQGQAFFYFGSGVDRFAEVFGPLGFVLSRHP
ncbi:MAG: hypothetical protein H0V63_05510 [Burkholderiaceae bacterium]|nr:hypothetical protein [Burkholderiaceae bacterium]